MDFSNFGIDFLFQGGDVIAFGHHHHHTATGSFENAVVHLGAHVVDACLHRINALNGKPLVV